MANEKEVKPGESMTDEERYASYLHGEDEQLEFLMEKYGNPLTLYINGYLHNIHEAEDLMIEAFSYLIVKRPHIRENGLKAYLYKSARNLALRRKMLNRVVFSMEDLEQEPDGSMLLEEVLRIRERNTVLHKCMEQLHPGYREAIYLTYFEDMTYAQAAAVMGKSVKQVTNLVYRGKQSLRILLGKEGITDAK